jgi:hypothetical protein
VSAREGTTCLVLALVVVAKRLLPSR